MSTNRARALIHTMSGTTVLFADDAQPEQLDARLAIMRGMSRDYGARLCVIEYRIVEDRDARAEMATLPPADEIVTFQETSNIVLDDKIGPECFRGSDYE